jgi:hypothetical protein
MGRWCRENAILRRKTDKCHGTGAGHSGQIFLPGRKKVLAEKGGEWYHKSNEGLSLVVWRLSSNGLLEKTAF